MELKEIQKIVSEIQELTSKQDYEQAHEKEDSLYLKILEYIAEGFWNADGPTPFVCELAKEALKTQEILDVRWYA